MTLERIFIENRVYKKIETAQDRGEGHEAVHKGMAEFRSQFVRDMTDDDVKRLLEIRIRRISAYDIDKHRAELDAIARRARARSRKKLSNMTKTVDRLARGPDRALRQALPAPHQGHVDRRDRQEGRRAPRTCGSPTTRRRASSAPTCAATQFALNVCEYDRILAVSSDGTYRIMDAARRSCCCRASCCTSRSSTPRRGRTSRSSTATPNATPFGKRVHIQSFIHDKEYRFFKDEKGKLDLLLEDDGKPGKVHLQFVAAKRQRQKECEFDLGELEFAGLTVRGQRLAPKPVARVKHVPAK